jgi:hypothetical protein
MNQQVIFSDPDFIINFLSNASTCIHPVTITLCNENIPVIANWLRTQDKTLLASGIKRSLMGIVVEDESASLQELAFICMHLECLSIYEPQLPFFTASIIKCLSIHATVDRLNHLERALASMPNLASLDLTLAYPDDSDFEDNGEDDDDYTEESDLEQDQDTLFNLTSPVLLERNRSHWSSDDESVCDYVPSKQVRPKGYGFYFDLSCLSQSLTHLEIESDTVEQVFAIDVNKLPKGLIYLLLSNISVCAPSSDARSRHRAIRQVHNTLPNLKILKCIAVRGLKYLQLCTPNVTSLKLPICIRNAHLCHWHHLQSLTLEAEGLPRTIFVSNPVHLVRINVSKNRIWNPSQVKRALASYNMSMNKLVVHTDLPQHWFQHLISQAQQYDFVCL